MQWRNAHHRYTVEKCHQAFDGQREQLIRDQQQRAPMLRLLQHQGRPKPLGETFYLGLQSKGQR